MDKAEVASKTKKIIAEQLDVDVGKVSETSDVASLGADSLDLVEIVKGVENEFSILLEDNDAVNINTVGQAIDLIFEKTR
jgi:acyl carrier protein